MGVNKFHGNRLKKALYKIPIMVFLMKEKMLIESTYDFLNCVFLKGKLICSGSFRPTVYSGEFEFIISYDGKSAPSVHVLKPLIEFNHDIHIYPQDGSLCLYHSKKDKLNWDYTEHHLFDTIIPWTLEWFVYYELYLITGKWEHPFVEHRKSKVKS
jgi:hypothetical protein